MLRRTLCAAVLVGATGHASAADRVVVYPAYSSGAAAIVEGRVTKEDRRSTPAADDRKRDNFRRNLGLLSNDERPNRAVTVRIGEREWKTKTDAEGYFRVEVSLPEAASGWHTVSATTQDGKGEAGVLLLPSANLHGIISDVDDTIQVTEVNSTRRMMSNTLLRNPLQRQVVPGIVDFYRELAAANPEPASAAIFYLSASPRQLHESLTLFLEHNGFPRGTLITKRVTNDNTSEPLTDQFAYKTAKIEEIFARIPNVRFTLIGDDGEQDPEIFAAIRERFPNRVDAVWIRRVNPDPARARLSDQGELNDRLEARKP